MTFVLYPPCIDDIRSTENMNIDGSRCLQKPKWFRNTLIEMVNYWLAKQEPSGPRGYHILDLKKDKTTVWDGIHNNQALKFMRDAKKGDEIIYYHTGTERQAVGIMTITSNPYPNPKEDNKRFIVVDVKFKKLFKTPVTLDEMKLQKSFKN